MFVFAAYRQFVLVLINAGCLTLEKSAKCNCSWQASRRDFFLNYIILFFYAINSVLNFLEVNGFQIFFNLFQHVKMIMWSLIQEMLNCVMVVVWLNALHVGGEDLPVSTQHCTQRQTVRTTSARLYIGDKMGVIERYKRKKI